MGRNRTRRNSRPHGQQPATVKSGDDGGCLFVIIAILWYFGFVSFHSREQGQAIDRLGDIRVQLAKAEAQVGKVTRVLQEINDDSAVLAARRSSLETQVAQLELARDEIAINLKAASKLVTPSARSRWQAFAEVIFTGVLGNFVSAGLLAAIAWIFGKPAWRLVASRVRRRQNRDR